VTIKHLSTPKVDDLTIEPVERTLAPFAGREKPQLSPWLAAGLIRNGRADQRVTRKPASVAAWQWQTWDDDRR
jgi:hypothetical protein